MLHVTVSSCIDYLAVEEEILHGRSMTSVANISRNSRINWPGNSVYLYQGNWQNMGYDSGHHWRTRGKLHQRPSPSPGCDRAYHSGPYRRGKQRRVLGRPRKVEKKVCVCVWAQQVLTAQHVQPTRRCASGHQRPSIKGLPSQWAMALCNTPGADVSASAHPRP